MELKYINREIRDLATMEATNYISEYGLEKLKELRYLIGLHEKEVKKLTLTDVSQQRELLLAYAKYHNENFDYEKIYDTMIDRFLSQ